MLNSPTKPRRRWFQFGIGTMFVVVTVFAVFLGYHLNWIRQRHEFIAEQQRRSGSDVSVVDTNVSDDVTVPAPGLLALFGEHGVVQLGVIIDSDGIPLDGPLPVAADEVRIQRARKLFPEATLVLE
jgi:hypothetical protein